MKELYRDSFTVLRVDDDNLHIEYKGKTGLISFTNINNVVGRSEASFVVQQAQPMIEVVVDALDGPNAFILSIPPDGDGNKMFDIISDLRVI